MTPQGPYAQLQDRYRELLTQYMSKPRGSVSEADSMHLELERVECAMIDKAGLWCGKSKGRIRNCYRSAPRLVLPKDLGMPEIPKKDWADLAASPDYTPPKQQVTSIFDQGQVGSCACEAADGAEKIVREISDQEFVEFNPYGTYYTVSGGRDGGSSLEDNIEFKQGHGCFPESVWPRSKGWRTKPSDQAYDEAKKYRLLNWARISSEGMFGTALFNCLPVYMYYDGHSIVGVQPIDTLRFWYLNSWDKSWGDNGFGTMTYRSVGYDSCYVFLAPTWGQVKLAWLHKYSMSV